MVIFGYWKMNARQAADVGDRDVVLTAALIPNPLTTRNLKISQIMGNDR